MRRIAVIGSGISGMAAAYFLSRKHTVWLFEKEPRLGGHTNTVLVESSRGPLAVDTGFIVHNDRTYPNLIRLFAELGVATQPSDMSFAVSCRRTGFEFSSRGAGGFFAQRSNLLRPRHYGLFREILRFNRAAPKILETPGAEAVTLCEYLDQGRFSHHFRDQYLYPMASAVWSTPFGQIGRFPATTMIRFFHNHGMLTINGHPQWRAVRGGSQSYIPPLTRPYHERIVTGAPITGVARGANGASVKFADRPAMEFDDVVLACHGPQALALLESPQPEEREVLRHFATTANPTVLHTDSRLLPRREKARASWNYHIGANGMSHTVVTYHMNRLQALAVPEDYCVTLNANGAVDERKILQKMTYHHPLYTLDAVRAQARWGEISGRDRIHYCGAYWFYGFHEDGLNSALRVARALGVEW